MTQLTAKKCCGTCGETHAEGAYYNHNFVPVPVEQPSSKEEASARIRTIADLYPTTGDAAVEIWRLQGMLDKIGGALAAAGFIGTDYTVGIRNLRALLDAERAAHEATVGLPPLPKNDHAFFDPEDEQPDILVWNAVSMRAYATQAIANACLQRASAEPSEFPTGPIRYMQVLRSDGDPEMRTHDQGEWVLYRDHARIVSRLHTSKPHIQAALVAELPDEQPARCTGHDGHGDLDCQVHNTGEPPAHPGPSIEEAFSRSPRRVSDPSDAGLYRNVLQRIADGIYTEVGAQIAAADALHTAETKPASRLFQHPECASCKAGHEPCEHGYHAACPQCKAAETKECGACDKPVVHCARPYGICVRAADPNAPIPLVEPQ